MQGSDITTQVEVALPTLLPVRKLGRMQGGREGPLHSKQDGGCFSYKSFTFICFHANFSSFSFVDRQKRTAVKVIYLLIKKIFSAVYIFPCTLNGDIPYFLLQSAVADDVGHLILLECASLSWAVILLHFLLFFFSFSFPMIIFSCFGLSDDNAQIIVSAVFFVFFSKTTSA